MKLNHIHILNYKNIREAKLKFSSNVNCFVGANGMGKTNFLDAIYYLSFAKSAVNVVDNYNITHGEGFFMLQGEYTDDYGSVDMFTCSLKQGSRKHLKRNDKDYRKISEHIGSVPLVLISPADSSLVSGGSEERRRFLNGVISQYDALYLEAVMRYERSLKQRNTLLKREEEPDWGVVDVLEDLMAVDAKLIFEKRTAFIEEFLPIFQDLYRKLSGKSSELVDIEYLSHGHRGDLKKLLIEERQKARIIGYTLHGVHKDDLDFRLNTYPMKREGSQGQTKTYLIALKMAQFLYLKTKGEKRVPILLLDDIFDKLDADRVSQIVKYVSGDDFGQIFITDTNREHLDLIVQETTHDYCLFHVSDGHIISETYAADTTGND